MTIRERVRSRSRIRTRVLVAAVVVSLVTLSFLGALIIPLYTYPGVSWTAIIKAKQANPGVEMVTIINPNNGPGTSKDQNYVTGINNLRAAGVVVLGYDHTSYGARPLSEVEAEINTYKSWYNVSGIFFDEMSNVPGNENYYSTLNQYAKSVGLGFTVGNPGAGVPASFIGTMDVIVIYENQGIPNTSSLEAMTNGVPANHFAVIAYGVNVWNASSVSDVFNYASYVYVTPDTLPNPYGALTADFSKLVAFLGSPFQTSVPLTVNSVNAAGTPIVGVSTTIKSTNGSSVASGYTPLTHSVSSGAGYVVSVANYGSFVFDHWNDGSTNPVGTFTVAQGTTLTAYFKLPVPTTTTTASTTTTTSTTTTVSTTTSTTNTLDANIFRVSTSPSQSAAGGQTGVQIGYTNTYNLPISSNVWVVARNTAGQAVGIFLGSVTVDSGTGITVFVSTGNLPSGSYSVTVFATTASSVPISQTSVVLVTIP
jgi:Spherulation-specific family 4